MEKVISLKNLHEDARLQSSLMSKYGHELQLTSNTVSKSWENDKFADWNTFSPHDK